MLCVTAAAGAEQSEEKEELEANDDEGSDVPPPVGEGEFFMEFVNMEAMAALATRQYGCVVALWAIGMKRWEVRRAPHRHEDGCSLGCDCTETLGGGPRTP